MPYVFVCHAHKENDSEFTDYARELKKGLFNYGIDSFIDHIDFKGGEIWQEELLKSLSRADVIIVVANNDLIQSDYCHLERGFAFARNIPELIIRYENGIEPKAFRSTQILKKIPFTPDWWTDLTVFINCNYDLRKRKHEAEQLNNTMELLPFLSVMQLHNLLEEITEGIGFRLRETNDNSKGELRMQIADKLPALQSHIEGNSDE